MDEIERLLELGRMDLEAGYPQYARAYFEKVLALDSANRAATEALTNIEAILTRKVSGIEPARPKRVGKSALIERGASTSTVVVVSSRKDPGWLVQVLWFLFIGWFAGQVWIAIAWLLMMTIIGIPLAVMMLNKVPQVIALRGQAADLTVTTVSGVTVVSAGAQVPQHNILLRAIYFLLVGWWLSAIWIELAYFACLTIIGLPLGFWMFDKVPALVSLRR